MNRSQRLPTPSERGSALIISLLVLVALTGLGAVAFTSAISAAQGSRLSRGTAQAEQVSEGAMAAAISALRCSSLADAIIQTVRTSSNRRLDIAQNSDLSCKAAFAVAGADGTANGTHGIYSADSLGSGTGMEPSYLISYSDAIDARHATGSEVGAFCLKRVTIDVSGAAEPSLGEVVADTATSAGSGYTVTGGAFRSKMAAEVYAGPFPCVGTGD